MKKCTSCHTLKSLDHYNKHSKNKDGLQDRCRECCKLWYKNHKENHRLNVLVSKAAKSNQQIKICKICGKKYIGRYDRCNACVYKGRKKPCPSCGELMQTRATLCRACVTPLTGSKNPVWNGGITNSSSGYVYVRRNGNYIAEHRVIMEEVLGRELLKTETVHHKNGVRDDNRPENLELWAKPQPTGAKVLDLLKWAYEVIETYESLRKTLEEN